MIKQYTGNNAPQNVLKYVKTAADFILVVPFELYTTVTQVLNTRRYIYKTLYRENKNDYVIGVVDE